MTTTAPSRLASLYQRALICETFPAYRLEDLTTIPARDLLQAVELVSIARQVQRS